MQKLSKPKTMGRCSRESLHNALQLRQSEGLYRQRHIIASAVGTSVIINNKTYHAFCSNDYLGLAKHPKIINAMREGAGNFGVGSGASHLVSGHSSVHHALEEELAAFVGRPRVLLFSTGYMANLGVASALLKRGDYVFEDRLNHASLLDAGVLSGARLSRYPHNKPQDILAKQLNITDQKRALILSDGVFSMDGDLAPLPDLIAVAQRTKAWLMIDDAHGFGVVGRTGRGTIEHFNANSKDVPILMATLGKAVGTFGAFVAADEDIIETMIQYARSYIYTTALPPAIAAATRVSLQILEQESWRRDRLNALVQRLRLGAVQLGFDLAPSSTPIQPLIVGQTDTAVALSNNLFDHGFLVPAIRPPTVPHGSARLRITLSADHTDADVDRLLDALITSINAVSIRPERFSGDLQLRQNIQD